MGPFRQLCALTAAFLIVESHARIALFQKGHKHHKHEVAAMGRRQAGPPIKWRPREVPASTTPAPGVLTYITPSPGATPVAVTSESQIVTSYIPQFTLCELPPLEFFSVAPSVSASPSSEPYPTAAPYGNFSVLIPPGNGTCTTLYTPRITMVCATTLTALATKYTVTNCHQDLTFSTEYGYVLVTPTPTTLSSSSSSVNATTLNSTSILATASGGLHRRASPTNATAMITPGPSIATLTTYYLAPWQQLTDGTAPSEVDLKVCRTFDNGTVECIRQYQVWETSLVTMTATTVTSINISTTIHGVSQLIVETFVANVTEHITTFSMSTTMDLEFQTDYTTTNSANRTMSTSTGPTVYETLTVQEASKSSSSEPTSTTTIHLTSTIYAGTSTVTLSTSPTGALPPVPPAASAAAITSSVLASSDAESSTSVDFASMLGIGR